MNRPVFSPYIPILLLPLVAFISLALSGFPADWISIPVRLTIFFMLAYGSARYAGEAPALVWKGDFRPEARNVVGLGMFLVSQMLSQAYSVIWISLERPAWLASQYWAPAFVTLAAVGLGLMASAIPRSPFFPPFGRSHGAASWPSLFFAIGSSAGLFIVAHFPQAAKVLWGLWMGLLHAI